MYSLPFDYIVKTSKRAKSIRISIDAKGRVVVSKPWLVPNILVDRFVHSKAEWIIQALSKLKLHQTNSNSYWYLGKAYTWKFSHGKADHQLKNNTLEVHTYSEAAAKRLIHQEWQKQAKHHLKQALRKWSPIMQLPYKDVRIKDQKSRWGSCSTKGNLNFSWRLIMAPIECLEYVVIHELAHLKHMDHSLAFWKFVEQFDPLYREHRRWLQRHERAIAQVEF